MSADDTRFPVAWFPTAMPDGPAYGDPETTTWENFCGIVTGFRRHGPKDGPGFVPARFKLEDDGKHVRRVRPNLLSRTAIALDIETSKQTGERPPWPELLAQTLESTEIAAVLWTSHNHRPVDNVRFRVVLPLSCEIDHDIPAVEIVAKDLGLWDVVDRTKLRAESYFYLPSCSGDDTADLHQEIVVPGRVLDATQLTMRARALQEAREAEATRAAAEAHAATAARRAEILAAGGDPDQSLIERIRPRLGSLDQILRSHGYDRKGSGPAAKYRHGASQSGSYGADVKAYGGIERIYSHNGGDPLHKGNLPSWCSVAAVDAFDVVCVLDFGGDRKKALHELAKRFGLDGANEKRAVARLIHQLIRLRAPVETIKTRAYAEGCRLGLTRDDVNRIATRIADQRRQEKEAA